MLAQALMNRTQEYRKKNQEASFLSKLFNKMGETGFLRATRYLAFLSNTQLDDEALFIEVYNHISNVRGESPLETSTHFRRALALGLADYLGLEINAAEIAEESGPIWAEYGGSISNEEAELLAIINRIHEAKIQPPMTELQNMSELAPAGSLPIRIPGRK